MVIYGGSSNYYRIEVMCTLAFILDRLNIIVIIKLFLKINWIIEGVFILIELKLGIFNWEGCHFLFL